MHNMRDEMGGMRDEIRALSALMLWLFGEGHDAGDACNIWIARYCISAWRGTHHSAN
jgi:hypothetical protein